MLCGVNGLMVSADFLFLRKIAVMWHDVNGFYRLKSKCVCRFSLIWSIVIFSIATLRFGKFSNFLFTLKHGIDNLDPKKSTKHFIQ